MQMEVPKGFFAYPYTPSISEVVRNAISRINASQMVSLKPWEQCNVSGKFIIQEICKEIDEAALFCADLTGLNHNVMFELGFAIARNKRIWLTLDQTLPGTRTDFEKLRILTTIGYSEYQNSYDLEAKFFSDKPWEDIEATIFNQVVKMHLPQGNSELVLYLKSRHQTEASTLISKEVSTATKALGIQLIIDDPRETAVQPLSWYAEQAYQSRFVVIHLINQEREGAHLHNAKYSFVGGLVHGLDKPLFMLAQGGGLAPLDYRDILKSYQTGSEAERHLHSWLVPELERIKTESVPKQLYLSQVKLAQQLGQLQIGEPIAENENERLISEYFVETSIYKDALDGRAAIFVGRKGAGKSANFIKLCSTLQSDKRNLVCVIRPLAYEMQGIVEIFQTFKSFTLKSYAVESLWKYLIYSEIAVTCAESIRGRPSQQVSDSEKDLLALMDQNDEMLKQDFSVRLERCVELLLHSIRNCAGDSLEANRAAVSEALHSGLLRRLREALSQALEHKARVAILVDNLDKAWDKQSDIDQMTEFLLGLLGASSRIENDFRNVGPSRITLKTSLAVFLRADIFQRVMALAREPDKIDYTRLTWNDDELLVRIIDQRFASVLNLPPDEVWKTYFSQNVRGLSAKEYILSRILKRPRDLIYFVKASINTAVNRRHPIVTDSDILDAEKQYSQFAIDSILVENGITISRLESVLYEFLGLESELESQRVHQIVHSAEISDDKIQHVVEHLCALTFLGIEVKQDEFRYSDEQSDLQKNFILARHLAETRGGAVRYRVHPAFRTFLEISE